MSSGHLRDERMYVAILLTFDNICFSQYLQSAFLLLAVIVLQKCFQTLDAGLIILLKKICTGKTIGKLYAVMRKNIKGTLK